MGPLLGLCMAVSDRWAIPTASWPSAGCCRSWCHRSVQSVKMQRGLSALERLLECLHKHRGHVKPGLIKNLLKAGWAGHIDLGQAVANHVQANEQQAARRQQRANRLGDLQVAQAQGLG